MWTRGSEADDQVAGALFAQPGQETAFSRMEDLVFEESTGAMN